MTDAYKDEQKFMAIASEIVNHILKDNSAKFLENKGFEMREEVSLSVYGKSVIGSTPLHGLNIRIFVEADAENKTIVFESEVAYSNYTLTAEWIEATQEVVSIVDDWNRKAERNLKAKLELKAKENDKLVRRGISEGYVKKGGVNDAPTKPRPPAPKGQGGNGHNKVDLYIHRQN